MNLSDSIQKVINENKGNVGVAFKNLNSGETIFINENKVFPSASTIKLSVMAQILSQVKNGYHKLDEYITLTDSMKTGGDGILKELNSGHKFTLKEIITLMIIISDNTAANILIDMAGMKNVNEFIEKLGLKNTKLKRKMMDSEAVKLGNENLTCAADLCKILELLYNKRIIDKEYSNLMIDILKKQQVKGRLDLYVPEETIIAHKTGDLDFLEHDVGIFYLPNTNYILCVLTNETPTNKDGREIIGKISKIVYNKENV